MKLSLPWRRVAVALAVLLVLILLMPIAITALLPRFVERYGIYELRWQLGELGRRQLVLDSLSFRWQQPAFGVDIRMQNLALTWRAGAGWLPRPGHLALARGELHWTPLETGATETVNESPSLQLPATWQLPDWLPDSLQIDRWQWHLPCREAHFCSLDSALQLTRQGQRLEAGIQLVNTPEPVAASLEWEGGAFPEARLTLAGGEFVSAQWITSLQEAGAGESPHWLGNLGVSVRAPDEAWLAFLGEWISTAQWPSLSAFTEPVSLSLVWQLAWEPLLQPAPHLSPVSGYARVLGEIEQRLEGEVLATASLLSAVPLPSLGDLAGRFHLALRVEDGVIQHHDLRVSGELTALQLPPALAELDTGWHRLTLEASSRSAGASVARDHFPLQLTAALDGKVDARLALSARLAGDLQQLAMTDASLDITAAQWQPLTAIALLDLALQSRFRLDWQPDSLQLELLDPLSVTATRLAGSGWAAQQVALRLEELTLAGDPARWQAMELALTGEAGTGALEQVWLNPYPWRWQGRINSQAGGSVDPAVVIDGTLIFDDQLTLTHKARVEEAGWQVGVEVADSFLLAGNPFARLSHAWPELLTLASGRTGGTGNFSGDWQGEKLQASLDWQLVDVGGSYDTTAFRRANGSLQLTLDQQLAVTMEDMSVGELVQGFTFAPIQLSARYQAPATQPGQGLLDIGRAEAGLLEGQLRLLPTRLDLSSDAWPLEVELVSIDLGRLLAEHPSSDLTGSGKISGKIPLTLSRQGIQVHEGQLAAEAPGGRLQYRSARAADIARTSEGMKIITDALDDFHYTLLDSGVSYHEDGTLLLAVRLEGSNPAVEAGRAINFNITLEEDLPAMIASLQLGNQLGDDIKKRVQQRIQRRATP